MKFLIARLSAIGDCVLTIPVADQLRQSFPTAQIDWAVGCAASQILKQHWSISNVLEIPKGYLTSPTKLVEVRNRLRQNRYDAVIDPQGLLKSAVLSRLAPSTQRIGFTKGQAREQAWRFYSSAISPSTKHLVDMQLELLRPLGIHPTTPHAWLGKNCWGSESINRFLESNDLNEQRFLVINPSAGWESRRWSVDYFAKVAHEINRQYGLRSVVVWATPDERTMAEVVSSMSQDACIVAPRTSLIELAVLLGMARAAISSDSGPMHIAAAMGTPCVALFGPTDPIHSGPYGQKRRCLQACEPLQRSVDRRHADPTVMRNITPDGVVAAFSDIIAQNTANAA